MRVVAATPLYPPESRVGAWLSTHELLVGLVGRGHQVDVIPYMFPAADYQLDGVHVHGTPGHLFDQADVIISHLGDNQHAAREAATRRVPSVRMAHSGGPLEPERLEGAALVVCNSEATRESLGWDGPTIVIHPPVWPDKYRTTPGDRITLVNLSAEKGGDVLRLLLHLLPHIPFLAVKGGYGRQRSLRARNLIIEPNTIDMRTVYSQTRILLVPSTSESWGRVGIEAMCSGIPVVATPTPGLLESLGDAGTFIPNDDLGGWRDAIVRLLKPDEWAAASSRALARVSDLDPAADVARFCDAVENLVKVAA